MTYKSCHRAPKSNMTVRGVLSLTLLLILPLISARGAGAAASVPAALIESLPREWRDDLGARFDLYALRGEPLVITMAYATCHRICPMTLRQLSDLQQQLDARGVTAQFVIVGYDPAADDPAAWHQYRTRRGLNRANWHFLVGSPESVGQFARVLGFQFWKYDEHIMHENRIVYLDERGRVICDPLAGTRAATPDSPCGMPLPSK